MNTTQNIVSEGDDSLQGKINIPGSVDALLDSTVFNVDWIISEDDGGGFSPEEQVEFDQIWHDIAYEKEWWDDFSKYPAIYHPKIARNIMKEWNIEYISHIIGYFDNSSYNGIISDLISFKVSMDDLILAFHNMNHVNDDYWWERNISLKPKIDPNIIPIVIKYSNYSNEEKIKFYDECVTLDYFGSWNLDFDIYTDLAEFMGNNNEIEKNIEYLSLSLYLYKDLNYDKALQMIDIAEDSRDTTINSILSNIERFDEKEKIISYMIWLKKYDVIGKYFLKIKDYIPDNEMSLFLEWALIWELQLMDWFRKKINVLLGFIDENNVNINLLEVLNKAINHFLSKPITWVSQNIDIVIEIAKEREINIDFSDEWFKESALNWFEDVNFFERDNYIEDLKKYWIEVGVDAKIIETSAQEYLEYLFKDYYKGDPYQDYVYEIKKFQDFFDYVNKKNISVNFDKAYENELINRLKKCDFLWLGQFKNLYLKFNWKLDYSWENIIKACDQSLENLLKSSLELKDLLFFCIKNNVPVNLENYIRSWLEFFLSVWDDFGFEKLLDYVRTNNISFDVKDIDFEETIEKWFNSILSYETTSIYHNIETAEKFNKFILKNNLGKDIELKNRFKIVVFKTLVKEGKDNAILLKNQLKTQIDINDFLWHFPWITLILDRLKEFSNALYEQINKSVELMFFLFDYHEKPEILFENIEKNPFLIKAVEENPRMWAKLLMKFSQFDETSKENFRFLYDTKDQILTGNSKIEPHSLEFRKAMQEKLKGYKNNEKIIWSMEKAGINVDVWLDYWEKVEFILWDSEEETSFVDSIDTPLNWIINVTDKYMGVIKEAIADYKDLFMKEFIPLWVSEDDTNKLEDMNKALLEAEQQKNSKKMEWIQRWIDWLKGKIAKQVTKKISVWDKIMSDLTALNNLNKNIFKTFKQFEQNETKLNLKWKMIKDLAVLEKRVKGLSNNLQKSLEWVMEPDKIETLLSTINDQVRIDFDHYNEYRGSLDMLFSWKTNRDKERLKGRNMSIKVWDRNPDVDSYQGNYSPCCISVEGWCGRDEHESAISDYETDLGFQIVNIFDEDTGEPVTSAWCWPWVNKEWVPALMVDNIESNTAYSYNFSKEMSKKLLDYIEQFALSLGLEKIELWDAYNDLPTRSQLDEMPNSTSFYSKIWGYNKKWKYYMEAEWDFARIKTIRE